MNHKLMTCFAFAGLMMLTACADMSDTQRRTATGATIGGVAAGVISGEWGWAAAGAAVGAASGYLYDQHKKNEEQTYNKGVQDAKSK
jgi:osmotically inducible lipoprotein OsmB